MRKTTVNTVELIGPPIDERSSVFLNIPYKSTRADRSTDSFGLRALAYIASLAAVGLRPVIATQFKSEVRQARRILDVLLRCRRSVHHLALEKHNMTLEFGMAFALSRIDLNHKHVAFTEDRRLIATVLTDLHRDDLKVLGRRQRDCDGMINIFTSIVAEFPVRNNDLTAADFRKVYICLKTHGRKYAARRGGSAALFHEPEVFKCLVEWADTRWKRLPEDCIKLDASECWKRHAEALSLHA